MTKKERILDQLKRDGFPSEEVAVDLETFFNGNTDIGSIGSNLDPQPALSEVYDTLKTVRSLDKTENIFVRIADAEDGDWFYTDAIYVVGNWRPQELKEAVKNLQPTEIYTSWMYGKPQNIPETRNSVLTLWWD